MSLDSPNRKRAKAKCFCDSRYQFGKLSDIHQLLATSFSASGVRSSPEKSLGRRGTRLLASALMSLDSPNRKREVANR